MLGMGERRKGKERSWSTTFHVATKAAAIHTIIADIHLLVSRRLSYTLLYVQDLAHCIFDLLTHITL